MGEYFYLAKKEENCILQTVVLEQDCTLFLNELNESLSCSVTLGNNMTWMTGVIERRENNCLWPCVFRSVLLSFWRTDTHTFKNKIRCFKKRSHILPVQSLSRSSSLFFACLNLTLLPRCLRQGLDSQFVFIPAANQLDDSTIARHTSSVLTLSLCLLFYLQ